MNDRKKKIPSPLPSAGTISNRLSDCPPFNEELEMRFLAAMLAYPSDARYGTENYEGDLFYLPKSKACFDLLTVQYSRHGICDEVLLRSELAQRGFSADEAKRLSGTLAHEGTRTSPGCIESLGKQLETLKHDRQRLTMAGELVNGQATLEDVARQVGELATTKGAIQQSSVEELANEVEAEISGKRRAIQFPGWERLSRTQMLLPGTLSVICGSPGVSKSFFSIEPVWRWSESGERVAALELESGPTYHLRRILAQMAAFSSITRAEWCKSYPDKMREIIDEYRPRMEALRNVIQAPTDTDRPNCEYLLRWVRSRCVEGCRVLVIDPITMMDTGENINHEHMRFVTEAKAIVRRYGASLILISHPKRGKPGETILPCLENLPNSSAYERFSDTILWLESIEESIEEFENGVERKVNRYLHCLKVRLAANPGRLAFYFDGDSLRHLECGRI